MRKTLIGCCLLASACTSTAWAHHGGGTFDATKCYVFHGTVRQLAWANPHAWIYVEIPKSNGSEELWGFEFGTIAGLSRAGFRPSDFNMGTQVKVTAYVNRNESKHTGSANRLVLQDGRVLAGAQATGSIPGGAPRPGAPGAGPSAGAAPPGIPGPGGPPGGAASRQGTPCHDYN